MRGEDLAHVLKWQYTRWRQLVGCEHLLFKCSREKLASDCSELTRLHWFCNRRSHRQSAKCCGCTRMKILPLTKRHDTCAQSDIVKHDSLDQCLTGPEHYSCPRNQNKKHCCKCSYDIWKMGNEQVLTYHQASRLVEIQARKQKEMHDELHALDQMKLCEGPSFQCRPMRFCKQGMHTKCERHLGEYMDMCCRCMHKSFVECQAPEIVKTPLEATTKAMKERISMSEMSGYADDCDWNTSRKLPRYGERRMCMSGNRVHMMCQTHKDSDRMVCCECWRDLCHQRMLLSEMFHRPGMEIDCKCSNCKQWRKQTIERIENGDLVDEFVVTQFEKKGLLKMTVERAKKLGWDIDQMIEDNPSWDVQSLLDEIHFTEYMSDDSLSVSSQAGEDGEIVKHIDNKFDCMCDECFMWREEMIEMFLEGYQLDDGGFVEKELRKRGLIPGKVFVTKQGQVTSHQTGTTQNSGGR